MLADEQYTIRKNRMKRLRIGMQILILAGLAAICIPALLTLKTYVPYQQQQAVVSGDKGFIALSYFGVDRLDNHELISEERLREHLQALKQRGYVTVTQQDIIDYYQAGKALPEKSLFLIFEDGRRDTAVFSQKIMEELNFKATVLSYPEKFAKDDSKFLMPQELSELEKTTFWELGTNGYRLAFINVFDRYNHFLGELDPLKHAGVAAYLGRRYNHYLMDYIRDEYGVPQESYSRMKARINYDYEALRDSYSKTIGYVPGMYILMHSNTGSFGNNDRVSAVNEYWIKKLFKMNFNREGFCLNQRNSSMYDLTRMQPQAYWYVNHLLMRIKYDINQDVEFVVGDTARQAAWDVLQGAAEIQGEKLILTSLPKEKGRMRLRGSEAFQDVHLSVNLTGNKLGLQKLYLRADENLTRYVAVYILNQVLCITEKTGGVERECFRLDLDRHDGKKRMSVAEDKKAVAVGELKVLAKYADSVEQGKNYLQRMEEKEQEAAPTLHDGEPEYIADISAHERAARQLSVSLKGGAVSVMVDGKEAAKDISIADEQAGMVFLETAWGGYGWSQRNLADDVYDGVFEQLLITENTGAEKENVLFDGRLQGLEAVKGKAVSLWETVINWFIRH